MAKYDTTGPVGIDERISLIYFLALLAMVGTGTWLGFELRELANRPAPSPAPVVVTHSCASARDD